MSAGWKPNEEIVMNIDEIFAGSLICSWDACRAVLTVPSTGAKALEEGPWYIVNFSSPEESAMTKAWMIRELTKYSVGYTWI